MPTPAQRDDAADTVPDALFLLRASDDAEGGTNVSYAAVALTHADAVALLADAALVRELQAARLPRLYQMESWDQRARYYEMDGAWDEADWTPGAPALGGRFADGAPALPLEAHYVLGLTMWEPWDIVPVPGGSWRRLDDRATRFATDTGIVGVTEDGCSWRAHAKYGSAQLRTHELGLDDLRLAAFMTAPSADAAAPFVTTVLALTDPVAIEAALSAGPAALAALPASALAGWCAHDEPGIRQAALRAAAFVRPG